MASQIIALLVAFAFVGNVFGQGLKYPAGLNRNDPRAYYGPHTGLRNNNYNRGLYNNNYNPGLYNNNYRRPIGFRDTVAPYVPAVAPYAPAVAPYVPAIVPVDETPKPFDFSYSFVDEFGNQQFREEVADANGVVNGRYGYTDANGIYRKAEYVAGGLGAQYTINTNEPGTKTSQPADVTIISEAPEVHYEQPILRNAYQPPVGQYLDTSRRPYYGGAPNLAYGYPGQHAVGGRYQQFRGPAAQQYALASSVSSAKAVKAEKKE